MINVCPPNGKRYHLLDWFYSLRAIIGLHWWQSSAKLMDNCRTTCLVFGKGIESLLLYSLFLAWGCKDYFMLQCGGVYSFL